MMVALARLKYFLLGLVFGTQLTNGCLKNDNEKGKDFPQTFPLFNAELVKKGNKLVHLALVTDVFLRYTSRMHLSTSFVKFSMAERAQHGISPRPICPQHK